MENLFFIKKGTDECKKIEDAVGSYKMKEVYAAIIEGDFRLWIAKEGFALNFIDFDSYDYYSTKYTEDFEKLCDELEIEWDDLINQIFPNLETSINEDFFKEWEGYLVEEL